MDRQDLSLDLLLQETLALSEFLRSHSVDKNHFNQKTNAEFNSKVEFSDDTDYLLDLADSIVSEPLRPTENYIVAEELNYFEKFPEAAGILYKIDNGISTFCVRGFSSSNLRQSVEELVLANCSKRPILKLQIDEGLAEVQFFQTKNLELADAIKEQVINRRFPHLEDSLCNISDPGFSWWMNLNPSDNDGGGKFEIFFRSHGINRAEKYIQLGPIGDGAMAALRMNQARTLLRSSFPIREFSCDDKSFSLASTKPDHSGFLSFKNIFLEGSNHTVEENFPDNSMGRTLFYYFHELAVVRKFWIEVKSKLS